MSDPTTRLDAGNDAPERDAMAGQATYELASAVAASLATGDEQRLAPLLAEHVVCRTPGRHPTSGVHEGRDAVLRSLMPSAQAEVRGVHTELTELIADGRRAFVVLRTTAQLREHAAVVPIDVEIALHLQTDGERVIAITEYNDDQYALDRVVHGSSAPPGEHDASRPTHRWRTRWRR